MQSPGIPPKSCSLTLLQDAALIGRRLLLFNDAADLLHVDGCSAGLHTVLDACCDCMLSVQLALLQLPAVFISSFAAPGDAVPHI
jgi:hypothetical protein